MMSATFFTRASCSIGVALSGAHHVAVGAAASSLPVAGVAAGASSSLSHEHKPQSWGRELQARVDTDEEHRRHVYNDCGFSPAERDILDEYELPADDNFNINRCGDPHLGNWGDATWRTALDPYCRCICRSSKMLERLNLNLDPTEYCKANPYLLEGKDKILKPFEDVRVLIALAITFFVVSFICLRSCGVLQEFSCCCAFCLPACCFPRCLGYTNEDEKDEEEKRRREREARQKSAQAAAQRGALALHGGNKNHPEVRAMQIEAERREIARAKRIANLQEREAHNIAEQLEEKYSMPRSAAHMHERNADKWQKKMENAIPMGAMFAA